MFDCVKSISASVVLLTIVIDEAAAQPCFVFRPPITEGELVWDARPADLDGDGDTDVVVVALTPTAELAWYQNDGTVPPSFTRHSIGTLDFGIATLALGSIDADDSLDIVVADGGTLSWFQSSGGSTPTFVQHIISMTMSAQSLQVADVNGDMDADIITSFIGIQWLENDGGTLPSFTVRSVTQGFPFISSFKAIDLDSDDDLGAIAFEPGEFTCLARYDIEVVIAIQIDGLEGG
ncbi:MAG: VCBS repeat-containing protein, partial [Planctomycetota bacterium]